jgi:D-glycero-alpha-D-manno-heptose 1-phosphate guanylyltransferase
MEAIILAGGFGTRLKSVVKETPKPMADINGVPFLEILLKFLKKQNIKRVILSVGYKKEYIKNYFKSNFLDLEILYSEETTPLKTGGAIKKALNLANNENIFVLNGDTFFNINLKDMLIKHLAKNADITIALKKMSNFDRYGSVVLKNDKIIQFKEKKFCREGFINGGIYIIKKDLLKNEKEIFSFEEYLTQKNNIYGFISNEYFIDIGIPKDYFKAKKDLIKWL